MGQGWPYGYTHKEAGSRALCVSQDCPSAPHNRYLLPKGTDEQQRVPAFELACPTGRSSSINFRHKRPFPFLQVSPLPEPPSMPPSRRPAFFPWWHFAISQIILFIGFHGYAPPPPNHHTPIMSAQESTGFACLFPSVQICAWHTVGAQYIFLGLSINQHPWWLNTRPLKMNPKSFSSGHSAPAGPGPWLCY